jgi:hypothetical protein
MNNQSSASQHFVILVRRENDRGPFRAVQYTLAGAQPHEASDDRKIGFLQLFARKVPKLFPSHLVA